MCQDYPLIVYQFVFCSNCPKTYNILKKSHNIYHFKNNHVFLHNALWQQMAVQDVLLENDIVH